MAQLLDEVIVYIRTNPTVVAGLCIAVLVIGVTQAVVSAALGGGLRSGTLTDTYAPFELIARTAVSQNTFIYRFALPKDDSLLGLPLGQHISLCATIDGKMVRRPYTPITPSCTRGYFELLVKTYPAPHGTMSRYLESLPIGNTIDVRGPLGKFSYKRGQHRRLCMIAGGTGITPMYQLLQHVLTTPNDNTQITMVFANVTENDILLRGSLDQLASSYPNQFSVHYVLNNPPRAWNGGVGFVTEDILAEKFGTCQDADLALLCGPPPMNKAMKAILMKLGYKDAQLFKF